VERPRPGPPAARPRGLELGVASDSDPGRRAPVSRGANGSDSVSPPLTVHALSPGADSRPEEVAICDLCGLVSRLPPPPVCPACGGGFS